MYPSFFNCHNCNCHRPIFYLFTFLLFYLFTFSLPGPRVPRAVRCSRRRHNARCWNPHPSLQDGNSGAARPDTPCRSSSCDRCARWFSYPRPDPWYGDPAPFRRMLYKSKGTVPIGRGLIWNRPLWDNSDSYCVFGLSWSQPKKLYSFSSAIPKLSTKPFPSSRLARPSTIDLTIFSVVLVFIS